MEISRRSNKVPFGLKDGQLLYVSQVEVGDACGCICPDPACAQPLTARNKAFPGRKRAPYFCHKTTTTTCGGRESALHRKGKEVLMKAPRLLLPAWSALNGELTIETIEAMLGPDGMQEVVLSEGQMRPDVDVMAIVGRMPFQHLYIEIKVSHAVDWAKRERAIAQGYDMIEIDLADVSDEDLLDETVFSEHVLNRANNRHWINLANASFISKMTKQSIHEIRSEVVRDKRVPTKKGNTMIFQEQEMYVHPSTGESPSAVYGELSNAYQNNQRVDCFGNSLPYAPGLYLQGRQWRIHGFYDDSHFKTQLRRIIQDTPLNQQKELL